METILNPSVMLIIIYAAVALYLVITKKSNALGRLAAASLIALAWMLVAHSQYGYNVAMLTVFGINLFPLFAWALGLFMCSLIYSRFRHLLPASTWWWQPISFSLMYILLLLTAETVAYHQFGIMNLASAAYAGLPVCDCLHAPTWMQMAYFLMGPIYFMTCALLGLESSSRVPRPKKSPSGAAAS